MILINPPSPFLLDDRVFPSLGVLRVADAADCPVLDLSGNSDFEETVGRHFSDRQYGVIGITATTPQMPYVTQIAKLLRNISPARLLIGGPHVTLCHTGSYRAESHRRMLAETFDTIVAGDGEAVIHDVLAGATGLIRADRRNDPGFLPNGEMPTGRHRIDLKSYRYEIDGCPATSLISQLGCPFNCGFCGGRNSHAFRVIRKRGIAGVVAEIEQIYREYGFTGFMFYDDELNVNPAMLSLMDALCGLQDRLGVEFRFRGFIKAELFNDGQAAAMYRAGFRWLLCGFEAAHPRILRNIRKRATVDDNERVLEIAGRHGLKVKALMSIGHPGETDETALAIETWLQAKRPADFDCTVITPYPGTPYYDDSRLSHGRWTYEINGDRLHSVDVDYSVTADFYKGIPGEYRSHVFTDALDADEIPPLRDRIEANARRYIGPVGNARERQFEHSMGQA